jgi:hypothetical protein
MYTLVIDPIFGYKVLIDTMPVLIGAGTLTTSTSSKEIHLGNYAASITPYQPAGWYDDVRIYARTLMDAEILNFYRLQEAPGTPECPYETPNTWKTLYWNNPSMIGYPVACTRPGDPNMNIGFNAPLPSVRSDSFSLRSEKMVDFEEGVYEFTLTSDDGVRLLIDQKPVIDRWYSIGEKHTHIARTALTGGTHRISIEYFENIDTAELNLSWRKSSLTEILPGIPRWGLEAEYLFERAEKDTAGNGNNINELRGVWTTGLS